MTVKDADSDQDSAKMERPGRGFRRWVVAIIAIAGVSVLTVMFLGMRRREHRVLEAEFAHRAEERVLAIERGIDTKIVLVESMLAFRIVAGAIDRTQFREYTSPLLSRHAGIQGLGINPRVTAQQRHAHEASTRREGYSGYQITERAPDGALVRAAERSHYVVAHFIEPSEGNEEALGFDIASEPLRRTALERAGDTGKLAATGPIQLVQETGEQIGILICGPVYDREASTATPALRRANLQCFVVGVFRIGDVVEAAMSHLRPMGVDVHLFDESEPGARQYLYTHWSGTRQQAALSRIEPEMVPPAGFHKTNTIEVAGRRWNIYCVPTKAFVASRLSWRPFEMCVAGLIITALVTGFVNRLLRLNERLRQEVNERSQAETSLRESEARQSVVLDSVPIALYVAPASGDFGATWISERVDEISGFPANRFIEDPTFWASRIHPDDRERVLEKLKRLLDSETLTLEYRWQHADGTYRWYMDRAVVNRAANGASAEIIGTWLDFTERKLAEEALRESGERMELALGALNGGLWDWNVRSGEVYFSPRWSRMLGYEPDEIEGHLRTWEASLHPEDRPGIMKTLEDHLAGRTQGYRSEHRMRTKSGEWIWVLDRGRVVERDDDGKPLRMAGTDVNITALKLAEHALRESEERLRAIIDNMPVLLDAFDDRGNIVFWNRECERVTGYAVSEIVDNPNGMAKLYPDPEYLQKMRGESDARGHDYRDWEWEVTCKDGTKKTVAWSEISGRVALPGWSAWGIGIDVTERKRVEAQSRRRHEMLAHVQRVVTVGGMATGLAHEINQPLAAIVMYSDACKKLLGTHPEDVNKARELMEDVSANAVRAGEIIQRLRRLIRNRSPHEATVLINDVVRKAIGFVEAAARESSILIDLDLAEDNPVVSADPIEMEQVLLNLIINSIDAVKSRDSGDREITIQTSMPRPRAVEVAITDTGPGVSSEDSTHLFDAFFTTKSHGLGMGLSISRSIIEAHGGRLAMIPGKGRGASFRISLRSPE